MTGSYSARATQAITAAFSGGPLDGQRLAVPGDTQVYDVTTPDPVEPLTDSSAPVIKRLYRYVRSRDVLKDGSVEFLYRGME